MQSNQYMGKAVHIGIVCIQCVTHCNSVWIEADRQILKIYNPRSSVPPDGFKRFWSENLRNHNT